VHGHRMQTKCGACWRGRGRLQRLGAGGWRRWLGRSGTSADAERARKLAVQVEPRCGCGSGRQTTAARWPAAARERRRASRRWRAQGVDVGEPEPRDRQDVQSDDMRGGDGMRRARRSHARRAPVIIAEAGWRLWCGEPEERRRSEGKSPNGFGLAHSRMRARVFYRWPA
jgi:hypothetical protein